MWRKGNTEVALNNWNYVVCLKCGVEEWGGHIGRPGHVFIGAPELLLLAHGVDREKLRDSYQAQYPDRDSVERAIGFSYLANRRFSPWWVGE
jgi:hypothetical protein